MNICMSKPFDGRLAAAAPSGLDISSFDGTAAFGLDFSPDGKLVAVSTGLDFSPFAMAVSFSSTSSYVWKEHHIHNNISR